MSLFLHVSVGLMRKTFVEKKKALSDARQNPCTHCFLCKPTRIRRLELTCIKSSKSTPQIGTSQLMYLDFFFCLYAVMSNGATLHEVASVLHLKSSNNAAL